VNERPNDLIIHADRNQRITYANQAYCDAFGISDDEIVGYDFKQLIHPEDISFVRDSLKLLKRYPHITHHEERAKTFQGWRWFAWTVKADIDGSGNIIGIKAIGRDITKVKQDQKELLLKKSQIEKVLEVGALANEALKLETVLRNILNGTIDALNAEIGMIFLKDISTGDLSWGVSAGLSEAFVNSYREQSIQPGEGLSGRIAQTGKPVYIQKDSSHDPRIARRVVIDENFNSFIGVPIFASDQIVGVMNILTRPPETLYEDDLSLCAAIGTNVGMAVKNAYLFEKKLEAEKALKKSEEKYRKLYEDAAIGIFHSSFDGRFLDVNPALAKMLGYATPKDVVDSIYSIAEQIYVEPQARDEVIAQSLAKGETVKVENLYRRKDGTEWNAFLYLRYVSDSNGQPICLEGFVEDITDRKRIEEALKESKTFLENMTDVAYLADDKGNILWVNPAVERVTGVPPEDIVGKPFLPFFMEADHASLIDVYKRTLAGESLENTLTFKSGVTCHFTSLPKRNQKGEIVGTFGVARDISERQAAEHALQTSEARLKRAQRMAKVGNWEYDIAKGKVWGSEEAFRIYGIDRTSEFLPLDVVESYIIDAKRVNQALVDLITQIKTYDIEFQINSKNSEGLTYIHSIADLICDGDGKPVKVVGVIQDITERKRAEKEREELEGKLRQAQKMEAVGRLAGGVAHDFNNMLNVIIGHAGMAMEDVDPSQPIYESLEEIRKAGERSSDLTRQLLAFARKQTVSPKLLDLNKTLGNTTSMLHRLMGEDIDLAWLPGENVWPVKVDPSQIDQILANLCVNARDAIADVGKVTIETGNAAFDEAYCSSHPGFNPGEYVFLAVSDDGCGMDAETLDNIFEPFFTTKESGRGTGLGLATVYGVVKQNGGFINVYSEPGQGTTFKIYLPRYRVKAEAMPEKVKRLPTERGHETILLVEDEIAILRMTAQMLERLGYQVVTARTPGEAIRLAREHAGGIHLLVTDVVMPEMNGRDLAKNILSIYPNLKRLFMSGYTANIIAHHGVLDEGVNFIQKPFSREQLSVKVREVLDGY